MIVLAIIQDRYLPVLSFLVIFIAEKKGNTATEFAFSSFILRKDKIQFQDGASEMNA